MAITTVIPDRVLHQIIMEGFRYFRSNPKLLAVLFQSLTQPEFERVVKYVIESPIGFQHNYPRGELKVPCVVLLLKNESESESFLGDMMGTTPLYGMNPEEHTWDTKQGNAASQSKVHGLGKKLFGPLEVISATSNTIQVNNTSYVELVSSMTDISGLRLLVVEGAGKGKTYPINKLGTTSIDIAGTFVVGLDSTSKVDIRYDNTLLPLGEPARVFDEDSILTRRGSNFNVTYQLDVIAADQEEVIYLYHILKAVLYTYKPFLEAQGIQNLVISGNDFGKKSESLPTECFTRSLNLSFSYAFSVIVEEEVYDQIRVILDPDCEGPASDVTINLFED